VKTDGFSEKRCKTVGFQVSVSVSSFDRRCQSEHLNIRSWFRLPTGTGFATVVMELAEEVSAAEHLFAAVAGVLGHRFLTSFA
jgi:hypothetical protein